MTGLDRTLAAAWDALAEATTDRTAAMRFAVLATVGADGAEARTVVLRRADRADAALEVYTDLRTAKVAEIAAAPGVSLVFWDPGLRLQIRVRAEAEVLTGPAVADRWQALPPAARADYAAIAMPGGPLDGPDNRDPDPGPRHFAVIRCTAREIDTVHLGATGHRRALFRRADGWQGAWLQP